MQKAPQRPEQIRASTAGEPVTECCHSSAGAQRPAQRIPVPVLQYQGRAEDFPSQDARQPGHLQPEQKSRALRQLQSELRAANDAQQSAGPAESNDAEQ